jgi:ADP-heptose:LPS heptosyltransferase
MTLAANDFPPGTPLRHFFEWNESAWFRDRRYAVMRDPERAPPAVKAALAAARDNPGAASHAAVFAAFEKPGPARRRILVIRLSALGDFIQALGPCAAIRRQHSGDHVTLLTTRPFADLARDIGFFDKVLIDRRPAALDLPGWLTLRRQLRAGRFDRVYDLQTSSRSGRYAALLRPGMPEWSGIAWRCSHPHANLDRDSQHTLDEQTEQLLMAGIYPVPVPELPDLGGALPVELEGRDFVLLVPGSSPLRPEKRWPADRFGAVARALDERGLLPVVTGSAAEAPLAVTICDRCPNALDLTGKTDLAMLATLGRHTRLTIGNDTGVCHLATAAGSPLIVLFSAASDPAMCAPRGRLVRVLREARLADLPAALVIAEAVATLGSKPAAAGTMSPREVVDGGGV